MRMKNEYLQKTELYEIAQRRCIELQVVKEIIEKRYKKYPEGKIHTVKKKNIILYYLRKDKSDKSGMYISRKDDNKIRLYLQKKYDEDILKLLDKEISVLSNVLSKSKVISLKIQKLYSNYSEEIKKYINPIDMADEDYIQEWIDTPFERKEISEDIPIYVTNQGERVRSKSELNIANMLFKNNIPYRYECPLILKNGRIIYPDFTILNVAERKEVYWEHRGMMDDMEYSRHTVRRMKQYIQNDLIIGKDLIITEETQAQPLGTNEIEAVITRFFTHTL